MKKIAITLGDPNSISPEITIKALNFIKGVFYVKYY